LLAAYSAIYRGATRVYLVDRIASRLERGASIGAIPIDFSVSDPVEQIMANETAGVRRSVDCVGYDAVDANNTASPSIIVDNMVRVTGRGGGIGQIGVQTAGGNSTAAPNGGIYDGQLDFPVFSFWSKGLGYKGGVVNPRALAPELLRILGQGDFDASFVLDGIIKLSDAPDWYRRFNNHEVIKGIIEFPW